MEQQIQAIGRRDYIYFLFLFASLVGGAYLMLKARGYLLGYDVSTLLLIGIVFMLMGLRFAIYRVDNARYVVLILVPIGMRVLVLSVAMLSWVGDADALILLSIIAFSEESFRAGVTSLLLLLPQVNKSVRFNIPLPVALLISNFAWLILHFAQRAFDFGYFAWLFVTGIALSVVLVKVGLGMATLGHFLVNLTG